MSTLFKDIYNESFYTNFSKILQKSVSSFDTEKFLQYIYCDEFESYELKGRMIHTAKTLHHFLSSHFKEATKEIEIIITNLRAAGMKEESIEYMFFPEYIALYGINDFETSVCALEFITQFTSGEFAVRPFIVKYNKKMLKQMVKWSKHTSPLVRRLATEGSRPRLPWAMALPDLKKNPELILPILDNLKNDSSESVRRSVANNLNDISKDNPDFVTEISKKWIGKNKETDWLIKHACRTLLKEGKPEVLKIFGFDNKDISVSDFEIKTPKVAVGDKLEFSFTLCNTGKKAKKVRIEYGLYYRKKNDTLSKKVFKISERQIESGKKMMIQRGQSFKVITTRKFYTGVHGLSIIINGQEGEQKEFELE